jgi:hypothetical protein
MTLAKHVVSAVANRLIADHYSRLPMLPGATKTLVNAAPVKTFAAWLAGMDAADIGFWLSSAYSHLVDDDKRRRQALFFTPPALGERMLDDLDAAGVDWAQAHIIDIACGGAAFLGPAGRRVADALAGQGADARTVLSRVTTQLAGIEIDPFLAKLSRLFIGIMLYPWIEEAGVVPTVPIVVGDALQRSAALTGRFDLVICNPPYRKLASAEVARLPAHLRELCFFQPNLYAMFMALSARLLNAKGVAGLLTPMSFLSGRSFQEVRHQLATSHHIQRVDLVEARGGVFLGVEQDTAITVLAPAPARAARTEVFAGVSPGRWRRVGTVSLDTSGGPWILPRRPRDAKLMATANGRTITDYGYASVVGHVILYRDRRPRYATLQEARRARAVHPVPMLRALEIRPSGRLRFQIAERPDCFIDAGQHPQGLVRERAVVLQRVTAPEQARRLICAPVPETLQREYDGVMGENHVTFLVAQPGAKVSPALLAQILGSEPVDRLFRCRSGANNVSTYELAHLPLPDPDVVRAQLAAGAEIDAAVRAGFGVVVSSERK